MVVVDDSKPAGFKSKSNIENGRLLDRFESCVKQVNGAKRVVIIPTTIDVQTIVTF